MSKGVLGRVVAFGPKGKCTVCSEPECGMVQVEEVARFVGRPPRREWVGACVVAAHAKREARRVRAGSPSTATPIMAPATMGTVTINRPRGRPSPCHACGLVQGWKNVRCLNPDCRVAFKSVAVEKT